MKIIKTILAGSRNPDYLATMRDKRCKNNEEATPDPCMATISLSIFSACGRLLNYTVKTFPKLKQKNHPTTTQNSKKFQVAT